ncbi:MAG TPA: hypothetical protein VM029_07090 [Opitutaceae bacterium]|nr:hypothetical protein [Opitutaceae bacterium]
MVADVLSEVSAYRWRRRADAFAAGLLACVAMMGELSAAAIANVTPRKDAIANPWFTGPQPAPAVVSIDAGRQLLVDDFVVEQTTLKRVFHQSEYHAANPVLRPDRPWEGTVAMPMSDGVWFDPKDRLFKMWYRAGTPPKQNTCYATSRDGVHWDKSPLDVVPGTNIVLPARRASGTAWLDLEEKDPAKRFKYFHSHSGPHPLGYEKGMWGLSLHYSADGIHWSDIVRRTGWVGDRSTVFYNPFRQAWVYSIRNPDWEGPRKRFYWESRDLEADSTWDLTRNPPLPWTGADEQDRPYRGVTVPAELYNLDAVAYESLMVGFFTVLRGDVDNKSPVEPDRPKPNNVCLGFSRDGFHWSRPDRRAFLDYTEEKGAWNWGNVQSVGGGCLVVGDTLYFYASARAGSPEERDNGGSTGLATLRRDGFASMVASGEGTLTTRPVRFSGRQLFVNLAAASGGLQVEVLDENGAAIPPFTRENSETLRGDSTLAPVTWKGGGNLSALAGKPVRFRFHLRDGSLFSFWVSADGAGASNGYVAAGGPGFTGPRDTRGAAALEEGRQLRAR